jgi:OOP family OmpA-OmpF porin
VESRTEYSLPENAKGVREVEILLTPIQEKERIIYHFVVEFDFDLSNIRERERHNLDSVVTLLTRYPNCTVVVTGHTDSVGTEEYNIRLGRDRAERVGSYVERYLGGKGVKLQNGMDVRTFGETQPVASNSTEEGRQRNRRVEISIVRNE